MPNDEGKELVGTCIHIDIITDETYRLSHSGSDSPSESWGLFEPEFKFLLTVCTPLAIHLTARLNRGGSKTSIVPFCSLNSPDKVNFIHFTSINAFLLCNFPNILNPHAQTSLWILMKEYYIPFVSV
jgi:hypothetical protein